MKTVIFAVWFGALPYSFRVWLCSAAANKDIDFVFVTDQKTSFCYDNIKTVNMSFNELVDLYKEKYGDELVLDRPYKLCDYKPTYGDVFENHIKGYDYWGYCDIDLVFGDLSCFLNKIQARRYDRIFKLGHLCFYKNNKAINSTFKQSPLWEETKKTSRITVFDESPNGVYSAFEQNGLSQYCARDFVDINRYKHRFTSNIMGENDKSYKHELYYWTNGKLFRVYYNRFAKHTQEIMYCHFQKRKMTDYVFTDEEQPDIKKFALCKKGFIPVSGIDEIDFFFILKHNPYYGFICEKIDEMRGKKKYYPYLYTPRRCYYKTVHFLRRIYGKIRRTGNR